MSFFAILFALLIEQARPLARSNPIHAGLRAWALSVSRNFDAGKSHHGWVAWSLAVLEYREAPRHPAVVRFARVEIAAHGQRPRTQPRMDGIAAGQGTCLLDQQSEQDGEETHGGQ